VPRPVPPRASRGWSSCAAGCPLNNPAEEMNPLTTVPAAARWAFPTRGGPPMTHLATLEPPTPSVSVGPIAARVGRRQEHRPHVTLCRWPCPSLDNPYPPFGLLSANHSWPAAATVQIGHSALGRLFLATRAAEYGIGDLLTLMTLGSERSSLLVAAWHEVALPVCAECRADPGPVPR
jgi:hypothetical protein